MRFNFIGKQANFGEGITPIKSNEKELLVPAKRGKKRGFKKALLAKKEVMDGSKR